jgi:hypothetical protein
VIGNAVKVMSIATGEEPEDYGPEAQRIRPRRNSVARVEIIVPKTMAPEKLTEIASAAAN